MGPPKPWVIAHRGASGLRPEHSEAAFRLGIAQGADFVEPDLVVTRDGGLLVRHDVELSATTDIADRPEFADRRTRREVAGTDQEGWFACDFDLHELQTLCARERWPELRRESASHNGRYPLLSFDDLIAIVAGEAEARGRPIGIVAELKHPAWFAAIGLPFETALASVLARFGRSDPLFLASFDAPVLKRLRALTDLRLVQLLTEDTAPDLSEIAAYADAIGPAKALILPRDEHGASLAATGLIAEAHAAGLQVFSWTFRSENRFLPAELRRGDDPAAAGNATAEYRAAYALGIDAVFSDHPADAVAARRP